MNNFSIVKAGLLAGLVSTVVWADQFEMQHPVIGLTAGGDSSSGNGSCQALYEGDNSLTSGVYTLTLGGSNTQAYCLMDATGGWTLVAAQYESNPVPWTGFTVGYDPSLSSQTSFTFTNAQIPAHSDFAVGRDLVINEKVQNFTYHTGNIPRTVLSSYTPVEEFVIHRNTNSYYSRHNPDSILKVNSDWNNSVAFDLHRDASGNLRPSEDLIWGFSPEHVSESHRGHNIEGQWLYTTQENYAWTLWVK